MRVGLCMLTLVPGAMGGSETYARALCGALAESRTIEGTAFVTPPAETATEGLPTVVVRDYGEARGGAGRALAMARAALVPGRFDDRFRGLDVVHYPFTVPVPRVSAPVAITLHDVQHLELPQLFTRAERAFRRLAYDRAARRARVVIVPSDFVRERAVALLRLEPACVHVIHHGVDHALFRPGSEPREPFLLYPAKTWPHKNHALLLEAFRLLRRDRADLRLVLTGAGTERLGGPPGVEVLGACPLAELARLYRRATCVVFPSLYEGFGSPPLEAMASGTPVAASNRGSLPEVCGDAAVLFDPTSAEAIAAGIEEALRRADELRQAGLERARSFTWSASARAHEQAYRAALTP